MVWGKRGDMVVHSADPLNAEPPRAALAESDLTGTDTFYVRNHGPVPDLNPERWRLRVDGLVEQPLELSLSGLRDGFACHEVVAVLQCAGNRRGGAPGVAGRHPAESASLPAEVADAVAGQEAAGRPVLLLARHQRRALRLGAPARRTPGRTCKPHGSGRLSGRAVQAVACRLAVPPMFSSPTGTAGGPL
jgi:hypothetical protein